MLDDVAAYLVVSPLAAVVVLVLGLIGWGLARAHAPALVRRDRGADTRRVTN